MRVSERHTGLRWLAASLLTVLCALAPQAGMAQGLVPADFFNAPVDPSAPTAVEANELVFDAVKNVINAQGDVVVRASGYTLEGTRLVYRRASGDLDFIGNVVITDPSGNVSRSNNLKVTGGLKQAFLDALTITGYDGSRITADSADYDSAVQTILTRATYAPCGECIDAEGRKIGWSVSATKVTYNKADGSVALEQPSLALLGVPVAWLPYLWIPNLSNETLQRIPRPSLAYSDEIGLKVEVPFSVYSTKFTDIILSPALVSGQGFLMGAEWIQRFDKGTFQIKASGIYQFNPDAFDFADARRDWRGAIQSSGQFVPVEDWTVGFAYAALTDSAYFEDYFLNPNRAGINEVYATHLTADTYIDARIQQFNLLGDNTDQTRAQQGIALPNLRAEHTYRFGPEFGQIDVEGKLLGFTRDADRRAVVNGIPYDYAYAGNRLHGMAQASWQNQYITGGAVVTPFAGARLDASYYDGNSVLPSAPPEQALFAATPIAALDVRYPLAARSPGVTHLVEPIAQIVYRGTDQSAPGITNEDAQSVVLDDTNLFAYNRFTGIDRQETGLRANIGGRYLADFDDGSHFELIAGQSFQLAGPNAFALVDQVNAGVGSGLETASSYGVLGAYGRLESGFTGSGKLQIDTDDFGIARAGLGVGYANDGWAATLNYRYTEAVTAAGNVRDQNEIGADVTVPVAEYWSLSASAYWDINANSYLLAGGGLNYDDGFLQFGASATRTGPTHVSPDETRVLATFKLKAPSGFNAGYSGAVPLGN